MRTDCPHCGTTYNVPESKLGKKARCVAGCGHDFLVTETPPPSDDSAQPVPQAGGLSDSADDDLGPPLPPRQKFDDSEPTAPRGDDSGYRQPFEPAILARAIFILGALQFCYMFFAYDASVKAGSQNGRVVNYGLLAIQGHVIQFSLVLMVVAIGLWIKSKRPFVLADAVVIGLGSMLPVLIVVGAIVIHTAGY